MLLHVGSAAWSNKVVVLLHVGSAACFNQVVVLRVGYGAFPIQWMCCCLLGLQRVQTTVGVAACWVESVFQSSGWYFCMLGLERVSVRWLVCHMSGAERVSTKWLFCRRVEPGVCFGPVVVLLLVGCGACSTQWLGCCAFGLERVSTHSVVVLLRVVRPCVNNS